MLSVTRTYSTLQDGARLRRGYMPRYRAGRSGNRYRTPTRSCPNVLLGERLVLRRQHSRKVWQVDHNGADGVLLGDVALKATAQSAGRLGHYHRST